MVAIYARQSIDKKDSISIESQIEKCQNEINDNEKSKIYTDKGFSGKNTDRPMFIQMMIDVKNGMISKVIVYKIDRISRAIVDFGRIMEEFKKYKVEFSSYTEKFDTTSPIGNAMLNIIMVFAQLERETIQMRVKDNYYERGKHGYYLGGQAPFGYNKIGTQLNGKKTYTFEENLTQSDIVKQLFNQYVLTDMSLGNLTGFLNENKINTNFGNPWSVTSVGRLLRNPTYVKADADVYLYLKNKGATMNNDVSEYVGVNGCYLYAERHSVTTSKFTDLSASFVTIGLHEGLISSDIWLQCQYKLDTNKQIKNTGKGTHTWLTGLLKCGYCGLALTATSFYKGNCYFICGGRKRRACYDRKKTLHTKELENEVKIELLDHIQKYKIKLDNTNEIIPKNNIKNNELKIQLVQTEEKISNLMKALADGNSITITYINQSIQKLDDEKKSIINEIQNSTISNNHKSKIKGINLDDCLTNWDNYEFEEKKKVAKAFINKIIVTDDEIGIDFIE